MSKNLNKEQPNYERIKEAVSKLLEVLNEELNWFKDDYEALKNTPQRITNFYKEWYENTKYNKWTTFDYDEPEKLIDQNNEEIIMDNLTQTDMINDFELLNTLLSRIVSITDIEFASLCSHHMLPFMGKVDVFYIPNKYVIGASKIPRAVKYITSKPSIQEKLTRELAEFLYNKIQPYFILVRFRDVVHTCMTIRGIKTYNSKMNTVYYMYDNAIPKTVILKLTEMLLNQ